MNIALMLTHLPKHVVANEAYLWYDYTNSFLDLGVKQFLSNKPHAQDGLVMHHRAFKCPQSGRVWSL